MSIWQWMYGMCDSVSVNKCCSFFSSRLIMNSPVELLGTLSSDSSGLSLAQVQHTSHFGPHHLSWMNVKSMRRASKWTKWLSPDLKVVVGHQRTSLVSCDGSAWHTHFNSAAVEKNSRGNTVWSDGLCYNYKGEVKIHNWLLLWPRSKINTHQAPNADRCLYQK